MESHRFFPGKAFISTILEMLEYKAEMTAETRRRYLMRAAMAGIIVGLFYVGNYTIQAAMHSIPGIGEGDGLLAIGKIIGSTFFGFALVFIYYSKSELLTSNMMITSIGVYFHRITKTRVARVLGLLLPGELPRRALRQHPALELHHHLRADHAGDGAWRSTSRPTSCSRGCRGGWTCSPGRSSATSSSTWRC